MEVMQLSFEKSTDGIMEIRLAGRLDAPGVDAVELRFNALIGANAAVLVDVSQVEFLTSLGIRLLLQAAKTVRSKGGKLVLLQPTEPIRKVLQAAGIGALIPVFQDREAATASIAT
jgi:anti-anti-sigma factor